MITTIIYVLCLMLPSALFGYCVRWMMDEERIAKEIASNKQQFKLEREKILKEIS